MSGNKIKQTGSMEVDPANGLVTNADLEQKMASPVKLTTHIKISGKEM